jgi:hypothetical protein
MDSNAGFINPLHGGRAEGREKRLFARFRGSKREISFW